MGFLDTLWDMLHPISADVRERGRNVRAAMAAEAEWKLRVRDVKAREKIAEDLAMTRDRR